MSLLSVLSSRYSRRADRPSRRKRTLFADTERLEVRMVPAQIAPVSVPGVPDNAQLLTPPPTPGFAGLSATYYATNQRIYVVFKSEVGTPVAVTLTSYDHGDEPLANQHLVDSSYVVVPAGGTVVTSVKLAKDGCTQFDTWKGDFAPSDFPGGKFDVTKLFFGAVYCPPGTQKGNEGLGNGVDPPPPGHAGDTQQNDDPPSIPGQPNKGWNK